MEPKNLSDLIPDQDNANKGTEYGQHLLRKSIQELGIGRGVLAANDGTLIAGNQTVNMLSELGFEKIIVVPTDGNTLVVTQRTDIAPGTKEFHELALADNKVGQVNLSFDEGKVDELAEMFDINLGDWGFKTEKVVGKQQNEGGLAERFVVPPFSVLDTRQGYWQARKKDWHARIGDKGESREGTLRKSASGDDPSYYRQKSAIEEKLGLKLTSAEFEEKHYVRSTKIPKGVSLLDPVLSEVVIKWFGLPGGHAFDPFAGDSVFGFVAASEGQQFTGIELRQEQADLNQGRLTESGLPGRYICDDGRNVAQHVPAESQDLLFSCPPYFDLEVYSDKENDASNQKTYQGFYAILDQAFTAAITCLKPGRFAVIVCGDVRDKKTGAYYRFPQDVVGTFVREGMYLYNELILIEQAGNGAIRANGQMKHRKVVKTHQQVLVFYKGNPRDIKTTFPEITYEPEDLESFGVDSADESDHAED
ncbi:hypothetical protein [Fibrella forsythiae]|uniref:DNA methylase N-4/N-6 domain-containing protein n=1 Tax=Fibrella forsythiae TaxID=2817061 RepID=A0ABS3JC08_9BACT|nr:hypothetical protein [Fibrella forsythiae]MBO0947543.1 hypothetical protein [Fibrella forsythiae]